MRKHIMIGVALLAMTLPTFAGNAFAGPSIGAGVHYLHNLSDIQDNGFDQNSFSMLGSILFAGPLLKFEGQLEYVFDLMGTGEGAFMPQAYVLVGGFIYGGLGIGVVNFDGEWADDPFYNLRAGVNLPLGGMGLDVYGTYQFWTDDDLEDLTGDDLDSITFAAILRFGM
jgi:hypothetical protein